MARPRRPEANGHAAGAQPQPSERWRELDAEDERRIDAERTAFRRVAEILPEAEVGASGRPSRAVVVATLLLAAVVVLAVVLYRMAPP